MFDPVQFRPPGSPSTTFTLTLLLTPGPHSLLQLENAPNGPHSQSPIKINKSLLKYDLITSILPPVSIICFEISIIDIILTWTCLVITDFHFGGLSLTDCSTKLRINFDIAHSSCHSTTTSQAACIPITPIIPLTGDWKIFVNELRRNIVISYNR